MTNLNTFDIGAEIAKGFKDLREGLSQIMSLTVEEEEELAARVTQLRRASICTLLDHLDEERDAKLQTFLQNMAVEESDSRDSSDNFLGQHTMTHNKHLLSLFDDIAYLEELLGQMNKKDKEKAKTLLVGNDQLKEESIGRYNKQVIRNLFNWYK